MLKLSSSTYFKAWLRLMFWEPMLALAVVAAIMAGLLGGSWESQTMLGFIFPAASCLGGIRSKKGRNHIVNYAKWRHAPEACNHIANAHEADLHVFCEAIGQMWRKPLRPGAKSKLGALALMTFLVGLPIIGECLIAHPQLFDVENWLSTIYDYGAAIPVLNRLELYAVIDSFILAFITHLTIDAISQKATKLLAIIFLGPVGALAFAVLFLVNESPSSQIRHGLALFAANAFQLLYDLVAWKGVIARKNPEKREHFNMWCLVDLPFGIGLLCVLGIWLFTDTLPVCTREGFLAGAILTQFIVSIIFFVWYKQYPGNASASPT